MAPTYAITDPNAGSTPSSSRVRWKTTSCENVASGVWWTTRSERTMYPYCVDWIHDIYGLVKDCSISTANALEILQSCTHPSICRKCLKQIDGVCFWRFLACITVTVVLALLESDKPLPWTCIDKDAQRWRKQWCNYHTMHPLDNWRKYCVILTAYVLLHRNGNVILTKFWSAAATEVFSKMTRKFRQNDISVLVYCSCFSVECKYRTPTLISYNVSSMFQLYRAVTFHVKACPNFHHGSLWCATRKPKCWPTVCESSHATSYASSPTHHSLSFVDCIRSQSTYLWTFLLRN